jgi:hypothetical protein
LLGQRKAFFLERDWFFRHDTIPTKLLELGFGSGVYIHFGVDFGGSMRGCVRGNVFGLYASRRGFWHGNGNGNS